ncbi:MAG: hypothetical protein Q8K61_06960 [Gallionella sp.]|nr:hypothetical protein [Gallionella sp.]
MIEQQPQGLAIYGAITGTIALGINLFGYLHTRQKDKVQLTVECSEDENARSNLERMLKTENAPESERSSLESIYVVTVRNPGSVEAHIQEVGIVDKNGSMHTALIQTRMFLVDLSKAPKVTIEPKAMCKFKIYIRRGEPIFTPASCFVIDQQQKTWKQKVKLPVLVVSASA